MRPPPRSWTVSTTIELSASGPDGLTAAFAPGANMVLHSLTQDGRELLATNDGLRAYRERGATMGIPLLHPWANRLSGDDYAVSGTRVTLPRDMPLTDRDHNGLPIHGALPATPPAGMWWRPPPARTKPACEHSSRGRRRTRLSRSSRFPTGSSTRRCSPDTRSRSRSRSSPAVTPRYRSSFGFHPYLRIPGGSRADAEVTLPVRRQLLHDASMIPTGESAPFDPGTRPLGDTEWDDGFADLVPPGRFLLSAGEGEVSLALLRGYPFSQVYAPPGSDFVCFEPMTAPANALVRGGPELTAVAPGESYSAAFGA